MNKIRENVLNGLTVDAVEEQVRLGNVNTMPEQSGKKIKDIIMGNIFTYFNGIFCLIALLLIAAQSFRSLTFLPVIIVNIVIGIVQQLRAKSVLDNLSLLSMAEYKAIREGQEISVPFDKLVLSDVIILESGQQIPADAEVLEGEVLVNEALLTGESDEINKKSGSNLMSGSFVVSGSCHARLVCVGANSYAAKLTAKAKEIKEKPSEMIHDINLIIKIVGIIIIPIGLALYCEAIYINQNTFSEAIVSMVGAVIGMIPEGLYLLVTVALALSATRLAKRQVLLHDMRSTEALARVDVLCVDKTGTITDNEMKVAEVLAPVNGVEDRMVESEKLLAQYVHTISDSNSTAKALCNYYKEQEKLQVVSMMPFNSKSKYSEIVVEGMTYRLGAPEFLLSKTALEENQLLLEEHAKKGERILSFVNVLDDQTEPLLFICIMNSLRPNVKETFAYLASQEVTVKVISGDNPLTVAEIAAAVGIPDAEKYIDATMLETQKDYEDAVEKYTVFGRVKPEQKKELVLAIKASGLKVAMTGDGVNDILAMKEADCSIAMGAGSDAARQAAQVVLMDSDFSHMKEIISEGRRNINNITRSATLFLYKNLFSMLLAAFSIINAFSYPLKPSQVSLISMFNIGIPAFLLALEANEKKQKSRFLHEALFQSLPAALTSFFSIAAMVVFGQTFGISADDVGIASTFLLSVVGFMILHRICMPMNRYRSFVFICSIIGLIFCSYNFNTLFDIKAVSVSCIMLVTVFAIAEESVMRNLTRWFSFARKKLLSSSPSAPMGISNKYNR